MVHNNLVRTSVPQEELGVQQGAAEQERLDSKDDDYSPS